jgi:hypothetical protein
MSVPNTATLSGITHRGNVKNVEGIVQGCYIRRRNGPGSIVSVTPKVYVKTRYANSIRFFRIRVPTVAPMNSELLLKNLIFVFSFHVAK